MIAYMSACMCCQDYVLFRGIKLKKLKSKYVNGYKFTKISPYLTSWSKHKDYAKQAAQHSGFEEDTEYTCGLLYKLIIL